MNNTLANRLAILEQEKADTEMALERVPAPVTFLPDVRPTLVQRWRELVFSIEQLADNPADHIGGHRGSKGQSAGSLGHCDAETEGWDSLGSSCPKCKGPCFYKAP